jgi:hypothetical protein
MSSMNICEKTIQSNDMEKGKKLVIYKLLYESNMSTRTLKCFMSTSPIIHTLIEIYCDIMSLS